MFASKLRQPATFLHLVLNSLPVLLLQGCGSEGTGTFKGNTDGYSTRGSFNQRFYSDADLCQILTGRGGLKDIYENELKFLCTGGGFAQLRDKGFLPIESSKKGGVSTFLIAGHQKAEAKMESARHLSQVFCQDFSAYRKIAPEAFDRVEDIQTENVSKTGCDYHFFGKKIGLFKRPEYRGELKLFTELPENLYVAAGHLTKSVSLIHGARNLNIFVQEGHVLQIYSIAYFQMENKGFHDLAEKEFSKSFRTLGKGVAGKIHEF